MPDYDATVRPIHDQLIGERVFNHFGGCVLSESAATTLTAYQHNSDGLRVPTAMPVQAGDFIVPRLIHRTGVEIPVPMRVKRIIDTVRGDVQAARLLGFYLFASMADLHLEFEFPKLFAEPDFRCSYLPKGTTSFTMMARKKWICR